MIDHKLHKEKNLHIEVSAICSNNCSFCAEHIQPRFEKLKNKTKADFQGEIFAGKDLYQKIIFTTGEPTLHPELINYVIFAKKCAYKEIALTTNGRKLANKLYLIKLIKAGMTEFIISIHGVNATTHDTLTCRPGSFAETYQGLVNLTNFRLSANYKITVSFVLNKMNIADLEAGILMFSQLKFIDEIIFNIMRPEGYGSDNKNELLLKYSDIMTEINRINAKHPGLLPTSKTKFLNITFTDLPLCIAAPYGLTYLCGIGESRMIYETSKQKHNLTKKDAAENKKFGDLCKDCKYYNLCEGIYQEYIDLFGWDEFIIGASSL